ncbi:trigger factor [Cardiobacterium valvarum]|uniref:Trigger factor n=1 Tax=Cardiobacterium valvarum F0432 TaxID=797473 RepID=G9ZF22_9GAMM|nr:trigger factor [Cardiobacterium valvarum]EHM54221.1 trigger factor [Cardiobacterium valvarum F0432]
MQSSVEHLEGLTHKLTVEVPAERLDQEVEKRLKDIRPRIRIDGFRPGKVPPAVVKQKYGDSVRQDVLGEIIDETYREAIKDGGYAPAASPQIELVSGMAVNEPVKYIATFEVMPEVNVQGLDSISITLPHTTIDDKDVDDMITTLRRQQGTFVEVDKAAEDGDRVTVDFVGRIDDVAFDGGSGENVNFIIGNGQMLPDFEQGLRGGKTGEERTFDVHFPEDYHGKDVAGKTAQFTATVKKVEQLNLPEVDGTFIQAFGIKDGDVDAFRKAIYDNMARELNNAMLRIRRAYMFDALLEKNAEQPVAEGMVRNEIARMAREMQLEQQIPDAKAREELATRVFDEAARGRVRLSLLINKLFDERKPELDKARVEARIQSIAATYEDPQEVINFYNNDRDARTNLEAAILEEQLIEQLYEQAQISEEEKTFQEVMALGQQRG